MLSNKGELRREAECAAVGSDEKIQMVQCEHLHPDDLWYHQNGQLFNKRSDKCLTLVEEDRKYTTILDPCTKSAYQIWEFDNHKENADTD